MNAARGGLAVALGALAAWWCAGLWRAEASRVAFAEAARDPVALAERAEAPPDSAGAFLQLAQANIRNTFPPDYAAAVRLTAAAIRLAPLESFHWLRLGRALLYQGRRAEAEAALRFSDTLNPNFPFLRREAIQLWTMLGNRSHASALARQLAGLGGPHLIAAAEELLYAGWLPDEAFRLIGGERLAPAEMARVLGKLRTRDAAANHRLLSSIPVEAFADGALRAAATELALAPPQADFLELLWRRESDRVELLCTDLESSATLAYGIDVPPLAVSNLHLDAPPFAGTFALGWQKPPAQAWVTAAWLPPASGGPGALRLGIRESGDPAQRILRWDFYRVLVPAGLDFVASVEATAEPSTRSRCAIALKDDGGRFQRSEYSRAGASGPQLLEAGLSASARPRIVTLMFERVRNGPPSEGDETAIFLRRVTLRAIPRDPGDTSLDGIPEEHHDVLRGGTP